MSYVDASVTGVESFRVLVYDLDSETVNDQDYAYITHGGSRVAASSMGSNVELHSSISNAYIAKLLSGGGSGADNPYHAGFTLGAISDGSTITLTSGYTGTGSESFVGYQACVRTSPPTPSKAECWAIDDDTPTIYKFVPDTANVQPPVSISTSRVNGGEALSWRPSTNELFMWDGSNTYVLNADTGADVRNFVTDLSPGSHVESSSFYIDPVTKQEELWLIVEDYTGSERDDRYLIRVDPDTGAGISWVGPLFGGYPLCQDSCHP